MEHDVEHIADEQRINEIASILAAGVLRLKAKEKQGLSSRTGDIPLDLPPTGSMCVSVQKTEKCHE